MEINSKDIKMNVLPNELDIKAQAILSRLKEYPETLRKVANIYRETEEKPKAEPWSSNLIE